MDTQRAWLPTKTSWIAAAILLAAVMAVGGAAFAIAGKEASLTVGLTAGAAMAFSTVATTRQQVFLTVALCASSAMGTLAAGYPVWIAVAIAVTVLATAPATMRSAGVLLFAPILTLVGSVIGDAWHWWESAWWALVGVGAGLVIAKLMKFGKRPPSPISKAVAWRHAVVLAIAASIPIGITGVLDVDHGYWVSVTLLVALRPDPDAHGRFLRDRVLGTLAGVLVALAALFFLPQEALIGAAFVCLVILAAYAISGNYLMQTVFLTPMLLLFVSAGEEVAQAAELSLARAAYTIVGAIVAGVLAWFLDRWAARDAERHPVHASPAGEA